MTSDLFSPNDRLEPLAIPDAEVYYRVHLPLSLPHLNVMQTLIASVPWRAEDIVVWGKTFSQPRLIAWYGDEGFSYTYSGIHLHPVPWTDVLLDIKKRVEAATGTTFNSVLLNYYRDNRDSMGFHSDDEPELGEHPSIASLSLGEERMFVFKHKTSKTLKPIRIKLASGSLLLMKGETQKNWKHGIEKESSSCGPRVNLTFRRITNRGCE